MWKKTATFFVPRSEQVEDDEVGKWCAVVGYENATEQRHYEWTLSREGHL